MPTNRQQTSPKKPAFTLIELLVVIAIIAVLMALLLPAIQKVREASNRLKCQNYLKQLALACHAYHDTHELFPVGAKSVPEYAYDNSKGTWLVLALPFLEQGTLYNNIPYETYANYGNGADPKNSSIAPAVNQKILPTFLPFGRCPSDDFGRDQPFSNYVGSMGPQCLLGPCSGSDPYGQLYCNQPSWGWTGVPGSTNYPTYGTNGNTAILAQSRGMFAVGGAQINITAVTDGLSNTFLIGETLAGENSLLRILSATYSGTYWAYYNGGAAHGATVIPLNYKSDYINPKCSPYDQTDCCDNPSRNMGNWAVSMGFKSRHTGGANFAFADGSVQFISESINPEPYNKLGCRNDGKVIPDY